MDTSDTKKTHKNAHLNAKYSCTLCGFISHNKCDYSRHIASQKHSKIIAIDTFDTKKTQKNVISNFVCICGNSYKYSQGLSKHKQQCNWNPEPVLPQGTPIPDGSTNQISGELVMELLKQNNEFRELLKDQNKQLLDQNKYIIENQNKHIIELMEKGIGNTINTNCTNITNKNKFNLNIFLNEQCKDAMNIMDFVNSLQLKLSDLERVGELGYVKGISHIVLNKLKDLDICKRPIHCSDLKRETMYVKDENAWEKENGKNEKITKMIKHVAHKNQRQINEWRQENPEHKNPESVKCDKYLAIVNQSMGGSTADDDENNYNKIIKNIAKEVIIDKEHE